MKKAIVAIVGVSCLLSAVLIAGCGSKDDNGPPGPAVGSATPQGGVITVAPQHGKRPHMGGGG